MEAVIDAIRAAVAPGATAEAKAAGIAACRAILAALDATPGIAVGASPVTASPVAAMVGVLRGMPAEQLLDLAIARVRAALPADVQVPQAKRLAIPMVTLPGRTT
ncbi:MAG: hypothetical protein JO257_15205 [Deltaproteobacteria bacterium]|nr:hypothetical protein [Deltaproteobacteria bacterium]